MSILAVAACDSGGAITGTTAASSRVVVVSPETVSLGLSLLHAMGIEVQQVFMGGASVVVNVTPHQAVRLRRYKIVEYVQPNLLGKRG